MNPGPGDDVIAPGPGDDFIIGDFPDDEDDGTADIVDFADETDGVTATLTAGGEGTATGEGTDTIQGDVEGFDGTDGIDALTGNDEENVLIGQDGDDTIAGAGGDDLLEPGEGDDAVDGGTTDEASGDTVTYENNSSRILADLGGTTDNVEEDGAATMDDVADVENLVGSSHPSGDEITGTDGPNALDGRGGPDVVDGLDGADDLTGGPGVDDLDGGAGNNDVASYASAAGGVTADLGAGTADDDGDGASDSLAGLEDLVGSEEADDLTGSDGLNFVASRGGDDIVRVRDEVDDLVNCGDGDGDVVVVDISDLSINCETVDDPAPPAAPQITGSNPATGSDDNSPEITGTAPAGSTVKLYTSDDCSGTPIATGSAASFASPGLTIAVADNSTTTMRAQAESADVDSPSACSDPFTYVEKTPPPTDGGGGGEPPPGEPEPPAGEPEPPAQEPSNEIEVGKAKLNKRKGTAKLPVEVPGPGELVLKGKGVKRTAKDADAAGEVKLPVKPKGKLADKLEEKGKAKVRLKISFTPTGGEPAVKTERLVLKQR